MLYSCVQEKSQKEALTRKQQKNKQKQMQPEEDDKPQELLQKPREYVVKFTFPNPPPLNPPVMGLYGRENSCDSDDKNHSIQFIMSHFADFH